MSIPNALGVPRSQLGGDPRVKVTVRVPGVPASATGLIVMLIVLAVPVPARKEAVPEVVPVRSPGLVLVAAQPTLQAATWLRVRLMLNTRSEPSTKSEVLP